MISRMFDTYIKKLPFCYRPQTKFVKVMFLHLSVSHSVHRGACMVGGMHGCGGHVWLLGVCMVAGGVCGYWGACVVVRGMHGCQGLCGCRGVCMVMGGMCGCWGACMVAEGWHVWLQGGMRGCGRGHAWLVGGHAWLPGGACRGGMRGIQQDTVNERAVSILLECILVSITSHMPCFILRFCLNFCKILFLSQLKKTHI